MSELKPQFLGINSLNSFIANISAPRSVMFFNHFSQRPTLVTPQSRLVKSGTEYELAKYLNDVKIPKDCIVRAIIPYIPNYKYGITPYYTIIIEYEKEYNGYTKIILDTIEIPYTQSSHVKFGFPLIPTEELENIHINKVYKEKTILATSPAYCRDTSYGFGVNANVAFMSHPDTAEDGFVVSQSFIEKSQLYVVEKRTINIDSSIIGLNIYGDDNNYKLFPNIGEYVHENGIVFAYRKRNDYFTLSDLKDKSLKNIDPIFDTAIYVTPGSMVVNVEVIASPSRKIDGFEKVNEQLETYSQEYINYHKSIITQTENIFKQKSSLYNSNDVVEYSPRLHALLTHSMQIINAYNPSYRIKFVYKKLPVDNYRVTITTMAKLTPKIGYKLTCCHGGKGVICKIMPDEDMPTDEYGNRADVIVDQGSTISRMNISRTYEAYFGGLARDNRKRIIDYLQNKYNCNTSDLIHYLNEEDYYYVRDYLYGLYSLFSVRMSNFIKNITYEDLKSYVEKIITDNLYLYIPPDNEINVVDAISAIENSPYKVVRSQLTYRDNLGNIVKTKSKTQIGNFYIMFLEKIADNYLSVSSARVNSFGFPVKVTSTEKNKYPHALTPVRSLGETETRILLSYSSKLAVAEMFDLTSNPVSHKRAVRKILESDKTTQLENIIDRNEIPFGQTRPLLILKHMFNCAGMNFKYVPESFTMSQKEKEISDD